MKSLLCFTIHAEKLKKTVNIVVLKENLEHKWWNSVIELMLMMELGFFEGFVTTRREHVCLSQRHVKFRRFLLVTVHSLLRSALLECIISAKSKSL